MTTTLRFLDKTPLGRIISRFSQDIREVDVVMSGNLSNLMTSSTVLIVKLITIVYFTPVYIVPEVALAGAAYGIGRYYVASQMAVKRFADHSFSQVIIVPDALR